MIVVGVDGSESARDALAWALAEARLRGVPVRVVCAWSVPVPVYGGPFVAVPDPTVTPSFEDAVRKTVAESIDALGEAADGIEVEQLVVEGAAAQVLVEAAAAADLLVVGSRGHGGFAGLLLGSVSQQAAQHATCPVVIVRGNGRSSTPS